MKNLQIMISLLGKYRFDSPIPDDVRTVIIQSRKEMLIRILKEAGAYSIIMLILINVQYAMGKIGIALTFTKTYLTVTIAAIITAATATGVTVFAYFYNPEKSQALTTPISVPLPDENRDTPTTVIEASYQAEVIPFKSEPELTAISQKLSSTIITSLNTGKKNTAVKHSSSKERATPFVINGSVSYLDDQYFVTIKLIESDTSRIVTVVSRNFENIDSLNPVSNEIADELKPFLR